MEPTTALARAVPAGASTYLVTLGPDGRSHVTPAGARVRDAAVVVATGVGRRTAANLTDRREVTLIWSPADPAAHTLIADGDGAVDDDGGTVVVRLSRAVLHRAGAPASADSSAGCVADCVEIPLR